MFHGSKKLEIDRKWVENRLCYIVSDLIRAFSLFIRLQNIPLRIHQLALKMNGGETVDTNLICKLPVQTSRDLNHVEPFE